MLIDFSSFLHQIALRCSLLNWYFHFAGKKAFVIQSLRGKPLIVYNDFTYCRHSVRNGIVRWTCSTHSYKCCKAVVKTAGAAIIEVKGYHNHDASELLINRGKSSFCGNSLSEQIIVKSCDENCGDESVF